MKARAIEIPPFSPAFTGVYERKYSPLTIAVHEKAVSRRRQTLSRVTWQRFNAAALLKIRATRKVLAPVLRELRERATREFRRLAPSTKAHGMRMKLDAFDEDAWFEAMEIADVIGNIYREFGPSAVAEGGAIGVSTARRAGAKVPSSLRFDLHDPKVVAELEKRSSNFVQNVDDGTKEMLRALLGRKDLEGASVDDMIEAITGSIAFSPIRAERIARTEVIGASNMGALLGYTQAEIGKKMWLPDPDISRIRDSHAAVDLDPIPIDDYFQVGDSRLLAPGDQGGDPSLPEDTINCLCGVGAYVEGS